MALSWWRHHSQAMLVAGALAVSVGLGWVGAWHSSRLLEDLQNGKQVHREDLACSADKRSWTVAEARAYLLQTANPSYTMVKQGPEFAINRLHPEFAIRLAESLREARDSGLSSAGIYSAYRPPAFGVGGFSDKFNSLHAYGLAVDLYGIGRPGSAEARRWHAVAASHGVICPYGPYHKTEWNHCQPTALKKIWTGSPLRESITANGPVSLAAMFEAGDSIVGSLTNAAENDTQAQPAGLNAQASRTCLHSLADSEGVLYHMVFMVSCLDSFRSRKVAAGGADRPDNYKRVVALQSKCGRAGEIEERLRKLTAALSCYSEYCSVVASTVNATAAASATEARMTQLTRGAPSRGGGDGRPSKAPGLQLLLPTRADEAPASRTWPRGSKRPARQGARNQSRL